MTRPDPAGGLAGDDRQPRGDRRRESGADTEDRWLDADAGPVVRPYALTGGRVRAPAGLDMLAYVTAETEAAPVPGPRRPQLAPEHRAILDLAREPLTVAEVAAHLDLALGVVRVLIGDLVEARLVSVREPAGDQELVTDEILQAVIRGLRAL